MIDAPEVEEIGRRIYRGALMSPAEPILGGAVAVALALLGVGCIYQQPRAQAAARLATVDGRRTIILRAGLDPRRANWLCGHELAHYVLDDEAWFRALSRELREEWCDAVGSWVCAPSLTFRSVVASVGLKLGRLADVFALTETSIVLRAGETAVRPGVAVMTPARIHKRGSLELRTDTSVRALARKPIGGVRSVAIRDEPRRVAIVADGANGVA